jgi:hypothetical protein
MILEKVQKIYTGGVGFVRERKKRRKELMDYVAETCAREKAMEVERPHAGSLQSPN